MSGINREKGGINQTIQVVASDSMKRVISLILKNYKNDFLILQWIYRKNNTIVL